MQDSLWYDKSLSIVECWAETEKRLRSDKRIYNDAVREALILLWEAADRICGKRLKALIPTLLEAMEKHGHLQLETAVRDRLRQMSAATIDRLLTEPARTSDRDTSSQRGRRNDPTTKHSNSNVWGLEGSRTRLYGSGFGGPLRWLHGRQRRPYIGSD